MSFSGEFAATLNWDKEREIVKVPVVHTTVGLIAFLFEFSFVRAEPSM